MQTIKLNISDSIYEKVISLLNAFDEKDVEIIREDKLFTENKEYLHRELNKIKANETTLITSDELNQSIDSLISKYE